MMRKLLREGFDEQKDCRLQSTGLNVSARR
jgi:hypothetical protein